MDNIYNFLQISELIATSGQPTKEEFALIKEAGYQLVVNLALPESPNAVPDEKQIVESQGMEYVHIPVVWEKPNLENVKDFFRVMETNADKRVFVHCAANKRVSAFMYLYRHLHEGINDEEAKKDLHQIWTPNEIWQRFIEQVIDYCK
ncbi:MAG: protein tyrosine phosphatase family protein [Chlorogloeopsis fritschii C42_A2020_084]|uniref:protein tyrosine phosphatase family protein n=1 Tax=Chlorogloeopsis fritschii TaxID=1124 RepID=UPI0019EE0458|nr:protein tyrosine phosphatase family protein [Chlorogloeopsis fritschii]MBF2005199.1 protein tyrosine phosphatase family protein [Chlorogloeopsis fritschii C42_A2020_084]